MTIPRVPKHLIEQIDRLYKDPHTRALEVNRLIAGDLTGLSKIDVMYWAVEYIAQMSIAIDDDDFSVLSRSLVRWVYSTHYTHAKEFYGKPDAIEGDNPTG